MSTDSRLKFTDMNGTFEMDQGRKKSGCTVTVATGFLLTFMAILIAVGVGVIVNFSVPREIKCSLPEGVVPPTSSPEDKWSMCQEMANQKGACM